MSDLKQQIESILSVAIDVNAPYAKQMIGALIDLHIDERLSTGAGEGWKLVPPEPTAAPPAPAPDEDAVENLARRLVSQNSPVPWEQVNQKWFLSMARTALTAPAPDLVQQLVTALKEIRDYDDADHPGSCTCLERSEIARVTLETFAAAKAAGEPGKE